MTRRARKTSMHSSAAGAVPSRPGQNQRRCLLPAFLALCLLPGWCFADGLDTSAEYISGFLHYVFWPDSDSRSDWQICIVGNLPADQDGIYKKMSVQDRHVSARRIRADEPATGCDVLDLTAAGDAAFAVVQKSRQLPVLTVGSGASFCSRGGIICLLDKDAEHKFEINLSAAREAGLRISARLLTLGESRLAETPRTQP